MRSVLTKDGDMVDLVVWRETGRIAGVLEAVLDLNPQLAKQPAVLPAGIAIRIPDAPPAESPPVFQLWE